MGNEQGKIHIIGLGVAEHAQLMPSARAALFNSVLVLGSERQLNCIEKIFQQGKQPPERMLLPELPQLKPLLAQFKGKTVSVLASGDPLFYGIGKWFCRQFAFNQLVFHPAVSSIQAVCHRRGIALQDAEVLSLHGRPLEKIRTKLKANARLIILTDKHSHPLALAEECKAAGFTQSTLTVCENLGYENESVRAFGVDELLTAPGLTFDALHITMIDVAGPGDFLPVFPGIPDHHYLTGAEPGKGMISKREVRLLILSYLQAGNDDIIWDIGAGCGGVAVELAYWNERVTVHAVECHALRASYLARNSARFGVGSNLHIHEASAPACFTALPAANKIFIGGSGGELDTLLQNAWQRLPANGILVMSAVVNKSRLCIRRFIEERHLDKQAYRVESAEISVKRGHESAGQMHYREKLPVEIFKIVKGE